MIKVKESFDYVDKLLGQEHCSKCNNKDCDNCDLCKHLKLIEKSIEEFSCCRNELCLSCGKYENEHLGACDGCRWKDK